MNSLLLEETIQKMPRDDGFALEAQGQDKHAWRHFKFQQISPQLEELPRHESAPSAIHIECFAAVREKNAGIDASVHFLHPLSRIVGTISARLNELGGGLAQSLQSSNAIMVEGRRFDAGREVVERELKWPPLGLDADSPSPSNLPFRFYASREFEPLRDRNQKIAGAILRCQEGIEGVMQISAEPVGARTFKITASIQNQTRLDEIEAQAYDAVLLRSLVSVRISMRSKGAEFIASPAYAMA